MMDENYEDDGEMQNENGDEDEDATPEFKYEQKEMVKIDQLVHSILVETIKHKSVMSETMVKKLCESVGTECN